MVMGDDVQDSAITSQSLNQQIQEFSKHIAGSNPITAIAVSDSSAGTLNVKGTLQVLLVIHDFQSRLMNYPKIMTGKNVLVFAVDQWIFERDVDRGFLGEAFASFLLFPYDSLVNAPYLEQHEIVLKKRLILELLENLVISYPELSYQIHIKPEYFMYEALLNRVRIFPPLSYGISEFLSGNVENQKVLTVLQGYLKALQLLESEEQIRFKQDYILISKKFLSEHTTPKTYLIQASKNMPRALFSSIFGLFPQMLNFFTQNTEALLKLQIPPWKTEFNSNRQFINPQRYVYAPTAQGLVSLADKVDIQTFAQKVLLDGSYSKIKIEDFGGVLNDVYLIRAFNDVGVEKKILVKRFKDWSSFKWFPLSVWSIGARSFAVLGRSRLAKECAIGELLERKGFNVPKVLYVSTKERLVFMEFIDGETLNNGIKRIANAQNSQDMEKDLEVIKQVGEVYAKIHSLNVALGDTKPENIMVTKQGTLYLLDFEQATRGGNKSWDIAEFLYFSGHYLPANSENKAQKISQAFIDGYLQAGGEINTIRKAGAPKYTRVFSVFTIPSILRTMSNTCKKTQPPN
ncbi:MAG: AarF/UbiB family protein [Candidatus Bathyarchaeota archaeon]|nr:AarF/UbiB family protein [Candidatus Bathyarchaeota archaeon]